MSALDQNTDRSIQAGSFDGRLEIGLMVGFKFGVYRQMPAHFPSCSFMFGSRLRGKTRVPCVKAAKKVSLAAAASFSPGVELLLRDDASSVLQPHRGTPKKRSRL